MVRVLLTLNCILDKENIMNINFIDEEQVKKDFEVFGGMVVGNANSFVNKATEILTGRKFSKQQQSVLNFISQFISGRVGRKEICNPIECSIVVSRLFNDGYCYHFAAILKATFRRGEICVAYPFGHIVWVDTDGTPYDVYGINSSECEHYIPEKFLGDHIYNFIHDGIHNIDTSEEDLVKIKNEYLNSIEER